MRIEDTMGDTWQHDPKLLDRAKELAAVPMDFTDTRYTWQCIIIQLVAKLAQEQKWKDEDPRMLREQIRVADEANNYLHARCNELEQSIRVLETELKKAQRWEVESDKIEHELKEKIEALEHDLANANQGQVLLKEALEAELDKKKS